MSRMQGMQVIGRAASGLVALAAVLVMAAPALAVPQFVPTPGARLHTVSNGPGATYNTLAAGDQISYDEVTGLLTFAAAVDEMNWYDPANGACATNTVGSNCNLNYSPDLNLTAQAQFQGLTITPVGGTFLDISIEFAPTGGTDIIWTDPADGGSTQLSANWQPGSFNGNPTSGLTVGFFFDTSTNLVAGSINAIGFATLDLATPYASLFGDPGSERIELDIVDLTMITPAIGVLVNQAMNTGVLPSFTAEANGQVYRVASADFVIPEPATGLLVGLGMIGLAATRRAKRSV